MVPVVDLFAGPGGLAEGFAACRRPDGRRRYRIALSIEKDEVAHRTLRLRAFLRQFPNSFPTEYYDFLNGVCEEPEWGRLDPRRWAAACDETKRLELGTHEADVFLGKRIAQLREEHGGRTVLLGGPPCQVYSVIGRSRNAGKYGYNPDQDHRLSLYEQYVRVLEQLQPAVAVLENVRGMLSARRRGEPLFPDVTRRLRLAGRSGEYRLFALTARSGALPWGRGPKRDDFLVHAEEHGVPQTRHRVFVICVRHDVAEALDDERVPLLESRRVAVPLTAIIGAMPRLRSRLSRGDSPGAWKAAVREAHERITAGQRPEMSQDAAVRFRQALDHALAAANGSDLPYRDACGDTALPAGCPGDLRDWIFDDRLQRLPNNETRAHMPADLARYLFAAAFGAALRRSPKTRDFPEALQPAHANWNSDSFDDRYRVQLPDRPCTTVTSHLSKDGHYFIHPDPGQCRSLTVREVARLQTFPDNYFFHGSRTDQYIQVGNAVPPFLARQIAVALSTVLDHHDRAGTRRSRVSVPSRGLPPTADRPLPLAALERS